MNNRKKVVIPIIIITIVILLFGSTFAYWRWSTLRNEEVNISLTFTGSSDDLYARINGGEPISSTEVTLLPTNNCLGRTALQRNISITYKNATSQEAKIELQMDVTRFNLRQNNLSLTNEDLSHIHWTITFNTYNGESCSAGILSSGTFEGITFSNGSISNMTNDPTYGNIYNLNNGNSMITIKVPANTNNEVTTSIYYAYIWIDENYNHTNYGNTNTDPMSEFDLQLTWHGKIYQYIPEVMPEPNSPEIVDGLIPVKLSDTGDIVTTVVEDDPDWYNYSQKKWANAILVRESIGDDCKGGCHDREYYQNNVGVTVSQSDILAYYVWIPRYSYKVWQYSGISRLGSEQEIEIKFVGTSTIENATKNGEWYTHPAFWWDDDSDGIRDNDEELSGIWVGKFETSHTTLSSSTTYYNLGYNSGNTICNNIECNNYTGLRVLPNVKSLRYNQVSSFFYASRFIESGGNPFGLAASSVDSHMMKNSEWGAVSYLTNSIYGINGMVRHNNQSEYITGCGALNANDHSSTSTCNNMYGTVTAYPQSTTGNVTGIFDMSGGAWEYVMGVYNNRSYSSGFTAMPDPKYYNNYDGEHFPSTINDGINFCTLATCGGHALNETASWYTGGTGFVGSTDPWFLRGGINTLYSNILDDWIYGGDGASYNTFRLVLIAD